MSQSGVLVGGFDMSRRLRIRLACFSGQVGLVLAGRWRYVLYWGT